MHDDSNQEVEEDRWNVLETGVVEDQFVGARRSQVHGDRDIVMQGDKEGSQGRRNLEEDNNNNKNKT